MGLLSPVARLLANSRAWGWRTGGLVALLGVVQPAVSDALSIEVVATPCATDGDCLVGHYCREAECAPQRALGTACLTDNACTSANCVDGVCCETACAGGDHDCQACAVVAGGSLDGACTAIADASSYFRPFADDCLVPVSR